MRNLFCILTSLLLLASCVVSEAGMPQPSEPTTAEEEWGNFELTLTGDRDTRATTTTITKEQADNFLVTIYKGSDLVRETSLLKDVNTRLSAGYGYRIKAESCTEHDAEYQPTQFGQRRYMGLSNSFSIKAGQTTAVGISCSVANAGVEVFFDKTVCDYFTTYMVTITEGDRSVVFDATTGGLSRDGNPTQESHVAYFNVDDEGTRTITYAIHAESPRKTLDREMELTLSKKKISRLNINYEMSTFSLDVTVDEEEIFVSEDLYVTDDDLKVDDGTTDANSTHDGYDEDDTNVDIDDYGDKN